MVAPLAAQVPIVTGELGENDCAHGYIDQYMPWADANGISYLAWTWDAWGDCLSLVGSYDGTPAGAWGTHYRDHLVSTAP